jgi:hypothetical protein
MEVAKIEHEIRGLLDSHFRLNSKKLLASFMYVELSLIEKELHNVNKRLKEAIEELKQYKAR